jgi:hypothetical protein
LKISARWEEIIEKTFSSFLTTFSSAIVNLYMCGFGELPNNVHESIYLDGWVRRRFSALEAVICRLI